MILFALELARMASQDNSSASYFHSAMSGLLHDSDTADFTLTCGEKEWKLHSPILAIRSPFFKAAVATNLAEKLDMKMEIKELDPEAMHEVINFMYGNPIGEAPFGSLLEASERFQMADMKKEVVKIGSEKMTKENVWEIGKLAEFYDIEQLLQESAEFIVKNDIEMKEVDIVPKLTTRVLKKFKEALKLSKLKEKPDREFCDMQNHVGGPTSPYRMPSYPWARLLYKDLKASSGQVAICASLEQSLSFIVDSKIRHLGSLNDEDFWELKDSLEKEIESLRVSILTSRGMNLIRISALPKEYCIMLSTILNKVLALEKILE